MNILAYEDIEQVEQELLLTTVPAHLTLQLLAQTELKNLSRPQNLINEHAQIIKSNLLIKKIVVTDCLKTQELSDANALLRMLVYNLLAAVFSPLAESDHLRPGEGINTDLLKTVKCTFYSKDLRPNQIQNSKLKVNDYEARTILAHFFKEIQRFHTQTNDNRATLIYSDEILKRNPLLMRIFVSTLRFVLKKVEIQGAQDYNQFLNIMDTVINIVAYFDLTFRIVDEILLFYEEKLFLTVINQTMILGSYSETATDYKSETQLNGREWPISSLTISLNGTIELSQTQQLKRKKAVAENDAKLFNCLLESSRSEGEMHLKLNKSQDETPHFQQSKQLYFGKRKKDESEIQKQKDIKKEFAKLILGSSEDTLRNKLQEIKLSEQIKEVDSRSPSDSKNINQKSEDLNNPRGGDMVEFENIKDSNSNKQKRKELENKRSSFGSELGSLIHSRNKVCIKTKLQDPSTPQELRPRKERFGSLGNDVEFIRPDFCLEKKNHQGMKQNIEPYTGACPCFQLKLQRNNIASNTVNFNFVPSYRLKSKFQPFAANKPVQTPNITVTSPQKYKEYCFRGDRVPTFLKAKIGRHDNDQDSKSRPSRKDSSERQRTGSKLKQRTLIANQQFKHLSQIIPNNRPRERVGSPYKQKSVGKAKAKICETSSIKKYDCYQFHSKEGLTRPSVFWQTTSQLQLDIKKDPSRSSKRSQYRKTLQQVSLSPNIQNIISPFRTHSPRRMHHESQDIVNQQERDDFTGFRKLCENRSYPALNNYRPSHYL